MADIVVVASYAPSLTNFRGHLLGEMVRAGHGVIAVAPDASETVRRQLRQLGVRYHDVGTARAGANPVQDLHYLLSLYRLLLRIRPDFVLSYTIKPNIYATIAAGMARIAHKYCLVTGLGFAFESEQDGRSGSRSIARRLLRFAFSMADGVIVQNADDREDLLSFGVLADRSKVSVVNGSGVDLAEFPKREVPAGAPTFLLIGRLLTSKGIREYAEAAALIRCTVPEARFHLVGWFDDNPSGLSRDEVEEWQTRGILEYHGAADDVRPWLADCHVYVLPSYREGTPRTVLEAMATGRAIVSTDVPGCRQAVVDGYNGYLVPSKDPESLAAAMMKFIESPTLASEMGANSRELAEQKYDVRHVTRDMMRLMGLAK